MTKPRIVITPGEPAGIGPDVTIKAAQLAFDADLIAVTDPVMLAERARLLNLPLKIIECDLHDASIETHAPGSLRVHPVNFAVPVKPSELRKENAAAVARTLQIAADACVQHKASAVVTGPVQKNLMNDAGIAFTGHTEFFAKHAHVRQTVMLFVVDQLKAALVTTHLPLKEVAAAVTPAKIQDVLTIVHQDFKKYFRIPAPRMLVAGLNPHAGESGHLGREEIDVIQPALESLRKQGLQIEGPLPADTMFIPEMMKKADVMIGMYHDQILPVIKYIGFDRAVNMTLGLPYVRTSVDHGTALPLAGTGAANAGSLCAAIRLAIASSL